MDMQLKRDIIRREREKRAWSQEHLAKVAGLGLRTVQRIESNALASYESATAIAAVLEVPVSELAEGVVARKLGFLGGSRLIKLASAFAASIVVALGVLFAQNVFADNVMLNVDLTLNDREQQAMLLTAEGKGAEILVEGLFKMVIVPTIQADGSVYLSSQVYEASGTEYVLVSEPELATANDKAAEFRVSTERGNTFKVVITPQT